jgi:hypothetical protein
MAVAWLNRVADSLEQPVDDDDAAGAEEKAKPTYH